MIMFMLIFHDGFKLIAHGKSLSTHLISYSNDGLLFLFLCNGIIIINNKGS